MAETIMIKLLTLPGIILGLSLHEFAHAWMSDRLGDPTPRRQGRLTINPIAHIDPLGFIALLLVGFGWGRPVMIDAGYYKNRRRDEFLVAIAGVTMNLIIAVILSLIAKGVVLKIVYSSGSALAENVFYIFYYAIMINLGLMVFNLIPCPPLDGWNIVTQIFGLEKYSWWYKVYQYGQWILLILIISNITDLILMPGVTAMLHLLGF